MHKSTNICGRSPRDFLTLYDFAVLYQDAARWPKQKKAA
jgi:hypothetical protein